MFLFLFILVFCYVFILIYIMTGIAMVKNFEPKTTQKSTTFSIIIPFRNEKNNLPILVESIKKLNYPTTLFEVILVDDASTDGYVLPSNIGFTIQLLKNKLHTKTGKKEALTQGIRQAKNQWIVTTDADCQVPEQWLQILDAYIQEHQPKMVVMPVKYQPENTFLYHFQNIEMLSLQGVTKGTFGIKQPFMCNGANFAYQKDFFNQLNGFENNVHIASGDDVFLLQKALINHSQSIHYISSNDGVVTTQATQKWNELVHQKVRWASKTKAYSVVFAKLLAVLVVLANLAILACFFAYFFTKNTVFLGLVFIKILIDILLLSQSNAFFQSKINYFFSSAILYPFFTLYIFFRSLNGRYRWK